MAKSLARYLGWQAPGWLLAAGVLFWLHQAFGLPPFSRGMRQPLTNVSAGMPRDRGGDVPTGEAGRNVAVRPVAQLFPIGTAT